MKRVGVLVGREKTFPEAIIQQVNERGRGDVVAEYLKLDGVPMSNMLLGLAGRMGAKSVTQFGDSTGILDAI